MDFQVIYLLDALRITSVTRVPNMIPRTLEIRGPDFRNVVKIQINDEDAPNFVVDSKTRIFVQIPDSQEKTIIRSIVVLSSNFTKTESSLVSFEFTNNPKKATGLMKMIQVFILLLLRTPGTDVWYPNSGGGLQKIIGADFSKNKSGNIVAEFSLAIGRTKQQIIAKQASNTRLSPDERLAAANILSAVFNANQTALIGRVELIAQSGRRAAVGLEL
ncbi:MAG: hypothetical protein ACFFFC_01060 [Candidatus Thorarchaeota archaeon]